MSKAKEILSLLEVHDGQAYYDHGSKSDNKVVQMEKMIADLHKKAGVKAIRPGNEHYAEFKKLHDELAAYVHKQHDEYSWSAKNSIAFQKKNKRTSPQEKADNVRYHDERVNYYKNKKENPAHPDKD